MDIITKNRFTFWIILILLFFNIAAVTMIWIDRKGPRTGPPIHERPVHSERTLELLQQELGFTDEQIIKYDQLRRRHARQTQPLIHELQQLKRKIMDDILAGNPDSEYVQETARRIGELQAQVEHLTFTHFLDLKELCGEEQVQQLKELIRAFHSRNRPQGKPPGPRGEGRPMHPPHRPEHSL